MPSACELFTYLFLRAYVRANGAHFERIL